MAGGRVGRHLRVGEPSSGGAEAPPRPPVRTQPHVLFRSPLLLQAFNRCQLKHAIALWQILSAHRSEQLLRLQKVSTAPLPPHPHPHLQGRSPSPQLLLPPSCCVLGALQGN